MQSHSWAYFPHTRIGSTPYRWYKPFPERLYRAITYHRVHQSEAYRGNPKKKKPAWPRWRREVARVFVILDVFFSQPEYWLLGNLNLSYRQCKWLRDKFYWETRLYRWATGYDIADDD